MNPRTITVEQAAELLGIGRNTAYEAVREGRFPVRIIRVGRRYLVPVDPLERLLNGIDGDGEGTGHHADE